MLSPVEIAHRFAVDAHGDQKYGDQPYEVHLKAVAEIAAPYGDDAQVIAYLHDVAEDTATTLDTIRQHFGDAIASHVALLTDEPGINRKERKAKTNAKLKAVEEDHQLALVVKAADRLANLRASANSSDSSKLQMYRREHDAFREAAFRPGLCDELWNEMDRILKRST